MPCLSCNINQLVLASLRALTVFKLINRNTRTGLSLEYILTEVFQRYDFHNEKT